MRATAIRPATMELLWQTAPVPRRGPKPGLSLERVVQAAIAVADDEGMAALAMRRVADRLGVGVMTLYRYVPGKAVLVDVAGRVPLTTAADVGRGAVASAEVVARAAEAADAGKHNGLVSAHVVAPATACADVPPRRPGPRNRPSRTTAQPGPDARTRRFPTTHDGRHGRRLPPVDMEPPGWCCECNMTGARAATPDDVPEVLRLAALMYESMGLDPHTPGWAAAAASALHERRDDAAVMVVDAPDRSGRLASSGALDRGTATAGAVQPRRSCRLRPVGRHGSRPSSARARARRDDRLARLVRPSRRTRRRAARHRSGWGPLRRTRLHGRGPPRPASQHTRTREQPTSAPADAALDSLQ